MKKLFTLFTINLCFNLLLLNAQDVEFGWAKSVGNCGINDLTNLRSVVDENGNLYTTNQTKYDNEGNVIWQKSIVGNGTTEVYDISIDKDKNTYYVGKYNHHLIIDGVVELTAVSLPNIFICKRDLNGEISWAKNINTQGQNSNNIWNEAMIYSMDTDTFGNIYLVGEFKGTVNFDPGESEYYLSAVRSTYFVLKLNSLGEFVWVEKLTTAGPNALIWFQRPLISVSENNSVYIAGPINDIDEDDVELVKKGTFILKMDLDGNVDWWKYILRHRAYLEVNSITSDDYGNVYFTGIYEQYSGGYVDFDPSESVYTLDDRGAFIGKFSGLGELVWVKYGAGNSLAFSGSNHIYMTGNSQKSIFIAKSDLDGNFMWSKEISSSDYVESESISVDNDENIYISGLFRGVTDFDPDISTTYNVDGGGCSHYITQIGYKQIPEIPTTKLRDQDCGKQLNGLNNQFLCDEVIGVTNYQYEFTNVDNSDVTYQTTESASRIMRLSTANLLVYEATYEVRVRAYVDGVWGQFGDVCNLYSPALPTTNLRTQDCGRKVNGLLSPFASNNVLGAVNYEYEFVNSLTLQATTVITGADNILTSLTLANLNTYESEYEVRVRSLVENPTGLIWSEYGDVCIITAPDIPYTKLKEGYCNTELSTLNSLFDADYYLAITNYEYEFTNQLTQQTTYYTTNTSGSLMRLPFANLMDYDVTYDVRVRANVATDNGNTWGEFGEVCTLKTPVIPLTKLRADYCNTELNALNSFFYADHYLAVTNYEYEFTNQLTHQTTYYATNTDGSFMRLPFANLMDYDVIYDVRVRAYAETSNGGMWGDFGDICTLKVPPIGATRLSEYIYDYDSKHNVDVYPNPTQGYISILTNNEIHYTARLVNSQGMILSEFALNESNKEYDMTTYTSGVYYLHISSDEEFYTVIKIVKY